MASNQLLYGDVIIDALRDPKTTLAALRSLQKKRQPDAGIARRLEGRAEEARSRDQGARQDEVALPTLRPEFGPRGPAKPR